tara:strand:+ start:1246 stop:1446 length:201 start_codon:yes stop_codon:yes gene_type:complete
LLLITVGVCPHWEVNSEKDLEKPSTTPTKNQHKVPISLRKDKKRSNIQKQARSQYIFRIATLQNTN